jgi:NADPH2:quinone reductase
MVMRSRSAAEKAEVARRFERELWPALDAGQLEPRVHQVLPLADVAAAHSLMERNSNVGKIVLSVS